MEEQIAIRTVTRLVIPFIQIFSLYVLAHGEIGPGGGFQGGVIFAASIILYSLVFGSDAARKRISVKTSMALSSVGVMIYAAIGVLCIFAGGSYLEYGVLPLGGAKTSTSLGMYGIEAGVWITVAVSMILIFFEMISENDD